MSWKPHTYHQFKINRTNAALSETWLQSLITRYQPLIAKWMIKLGKLKHVDYTIDELNELAEPLFPQQFDIDVPVGKGIFTILDATIDIPRNANTISVNILSSLDIDAVGNPLYRAHLAIHLLLIPKYDEVHKTISIDTLNLDSITLVNDEYSLLNDSKQLLNLVLPKSMQNIITGTFKTAMGLVTAGSSDLASDYLRMYLSGSKQRILDYHKPQLVKLIDEMKHDPEFEYEMDESDWQESLFREYGKTVAVEERCVRFKF